MGLQFTAIDQHDLQLAVLTALQQGLQSMAQQHGAAASDGLMEAATGNQHTH